MTTNPNAMEPCPWCEGAAAIETDDEELDVSRGICTKCGACGPFVDLADFPTVKRAKAKAAELWNTRPSLSPADAGQEKVSGADPAFVASPSSRQGVSTEGFNPGEGAGSKIRPAAEIWREACIGREGYCSNDLQDAARTAVAIAQREVIEAAAKAAEGAYLPEGYIWSESNQEKFRFGAEVAATRVRVLSVCVDARDSGRHPEDENSRSEVESEACQSGRRHRPNDADPLFAPDANKSPQSNRPETFSTPHTQGSKG